MLTKDDRNNASQALERVALALKWLQEGRFLLNQCSNAFAQERHNLDQAQRGLLTLDFNLNKKLVKK